ncbi:MAG: MBL fold metallo-hydrolase [Bacteroidetes bacterium]|nr:MBL fold metallo-hydrolase [Bacteroidota bacterium]
MREPLSVHTHPWHDTRHHEPSGGFRNPRQLRASDDDAPDKAPWKFLLRHFLGSKEQTPAPLTPLDPAELVMSVPEGTARVTWLGHSTVLIQFPNLTILTDPVWARRVGPFGFAGPKRRVLPPLTLEDLPAIHVVVLSHDHFDHLDPKALRFLHARHAPRFLVPLGVEAHLPEDADATMFDWHQYNDLDGLRVHCTPARHFSGRTFRDRNTTLWASWFFEPLAWEAPTIYYAGDSGYAPHFAEVRERHGVPDLVLMPIGAYRPRWMMRAVHVDPPEALQAFADLGARTLIPIHWGTYDLTEEPLHEPPEVLLAEAERMGINDSIHVLSAGRQFVVRKA